MKLEDVMLLHNFILFNVSTSFKGSKKPLAVNKVKRKGGQNVTIGGKIVGKTTKGIYIHDKRNNNNNNKMYLLTLLTGRFHSVVHL